MRPMLWRVRALMISLLVVGSVDARGGGATVLSGTVQFEGDQTSFAPGAAVKLKFRVNEYLYGSTEHAYLTFAVVPADEALSAQPERVANWPIYGALAGPMPPGENPTLLSSAAPYQLDLTAPTKPGKYKVFKTSTGYNVFKRNGKKITLPTFKAIVGE